MRFTFSCLFSLGLIFLSGCQPVKSSSTTANVQDKLSATELLPNSQLSQVTQHDIDTLADALIVKYKLLTNIPSKECSPNVADGACFEVELSFTSKSANQAKGWFIYFSQISPVQSSESHWFDIEHINGDIHKISLSNHYDGFRKGETKTLIFRANFWSLSESDALPNYIITANDLTAKVIKSTQVLIDQDTGLEILPYVVPFDNVTKQFKRSATDKTQWLTSEKLYQRNIEVNKKSIDVSAQIIPTPKSVVVNNSTIPFDLSAGLNIHWTNVEPKQVQHALNRLSVLGAKFDSQGRKLHLNITEKSDANIGSYSLIIEQEAIYIQGVDANGVFNGLQSLASLITLGSNSIPQLDIIDEPHYEFRGLLVDVARNFHSKAFILSLLEQMSAYKLNKLHLHLGDDEGWRLEIPSLPELTEVSSKRCFDPSETHCLMPQLGAGVDETDQVNGFYSVEDYQEILQAASARYIQVIPSLDMPGHSRAAVKAMTARYHKFMQLEQEDKAVEFLLHDLDDKTQYSSVQHYSDNTINVCKESSYAFVKQVMKEVKNIHEAAGQPLTRYHIGADETAGAWLDSPACKAFLIKHNTSINSAKELGAYFVERVANILAELNIESAAWIDGLEHTNPDNMPAVVQANAWNPLAFSGHIPSHKVANYNWQVIVSSPDVLYFDFPYESDPKEHGYYWASRHINTEKVFQFMPDNLPIHAEFWLDREDKPYIADDRVVKDNNGKVTSSPLNIGIKFAGIQGQLWSENTRTDNLAEHKVFPRLLALAERGWHHANWSIPYNYKGQRYSNESNFFTEKHRADRDKAWQTFAQTLGKKSLAKLDLYNIDYRLPTVGAQIKSGILSANTSFPGLAIEYQVADHKWQTYEQPVPVNTHVKVRSRNYDRTRVSRSFFVKHQ